MRARARVVRIWGGHGGGCGGCGGNKGKIMCGGGIGHGIKKNVSTIG